jgi:hypothetical protein
MTKKEKIEKYILDFSAYDLEPLHIIVSSLISEGLCEDYKSAVASIVELVKKGYLLSYSHSGESGADYIKTEEIDENELNSELEKRNQLETYPEGKEYFFKTSKKGLTLTAE